MGTTGEVLQALARLEGMCRALCRTGKGGAGEVAGLMLDEIWTIQDRLAFQDRLEGRESRSAATEPETAGDVPEGNEEAATDGRTPAYTVSWEALKRGLGETYFTPEVVREVVKSNWAKRAISEGDAE